VDAKESRSNLMMIGSFLVWLSLGSLLATLVKADSSGNVIESITRDLEYDGNNKLKHHYLVYPAGNPDCEAARKTLPYMIKSAALSGEALQAVFPGAAEGDCVAACLEKGTDRSVAYATMPHRHFDGKEGTFDDFWNDSCQAVEVCLLNYHSQTTPIKISWISPEGVKRDHLDIDFGERGTRCFQSFLGHKFVAEDGDTGALIEEITIEHITTKAFGISPPNGNPAHRDFDKEIKDTLRNEWKRHQRVKRTFSELGFKKGRLPDDIFASMGAFYYNNRKNIVREEWNRKGVFVNWWETDCSFLQIPWAMKAKWQERLRLLVEAWAGVPIEQTDMYGLRQYEHGARLLTHVDRESTHAVSLIVNIAQGNLTQPWPVEINDHADRLHEIIMEPGDIVYYESAKCLHARNRPLMGDNAYYVNLFTHYRPTSDPNWYQKSNHEGAPDPVVDVEGSCRLEQVATSKVATSKIFQEQLGLVEAVQCDDKRLGSYVSPTLFKASGPEDLIKWWQMTSPPTGGTKNTSGGTHDEL